jgi:hypothetical protein
MAARRTDLVIAGLFCVLIAVPAIEWALDLVPDGEVWDNRALTAAPQWGWSKREIVSWPRRFESYYADHLGLRGHLVGGYRTLVQSLLRSPDRVVLGTEGWLYLGRGIRRDIDTVPLVRDFCGRFPFSDRELAGWTDALAANAGDLARHGIAYVLVVVPNKQTIHPYHLPSRIRCRRGTTRLDRLADAARGIPGLAFVDLRPALLEADRQPAPAWYRTDTHWNGRGVRAAYGPIVEAVTALVPAAGVVDVVRLKEVGKFVGAIGGMVDVTRPEPETYIDAIAENVRHRKTDNPFPGLVDDFQRQPSATSVDDPTLPTAMVFHDSFFDGAMNRLLAESFSRTVFVWSGWPRLDMTLVERERPDVVIQQMVERNLLHPYYRAGQN